MALPDSLSRSPRRVPMVPRERISEWWSFATEATVNVSGRSSMPMDIVRDQGVAGLRLRV